MSVMEHPDEDRNSLSFILGAIRSARAAILGMLVLSIVNVAVVLFQGEMTIPFALSTPYYLTLVAWIMDGGNIVWMTYGALGISVVIWGIFLLCWVQSGKHPGWLTAALVLTLMDAAALVGFSVWLFEHPMDNIVELLAKVLLLGLLARGVTNAKRLKRLIKTNA